MKGRFYGWYMKSQSDSQALAVIPAIHKSKKNSTCSIQIISNLGAWDVSFPAELYRKQGKTLWIGENRFSPEGMELEIDTPEWKVNGKLTYKELSPLRYDIMGPFVMVPFMECRHHVWSMKHTVNGTICVNDKIFEFRNADGYWEGDEGRSFPREYAWTQSFFDEGSLVLSVADIPIAGIRFTGVIAVISFQGKQYRLGTYWGAKAVEIRNGTIRIVQGDMELLVSLLEKAECALKAPVSGDMERTIREGITCKAKYRFSLKGTILFEFETDKASFEYEYPY